ILAKMDELTYLRESKQPLEYPSCGSVFKRPEGHFTGKLIQEAELQGYTIGGAQISKKHAGFIINVGGATATDYINMIHHIQEVIWDLNKVALEPEVRILGKRSKYDTVDAAFGN
ncbi:UDP-N-acetylmuramate dehydrogenase, partial [Aerococcus urinaeequi]